MKMVAISLKLTRWLGVGLCMLLLTGCSLFQAVWQPPVDHLALGNPSQARAVLANPQNYLLTKPQYVLAYNRKKGIANWVSWQLDRTWLGTVERRNDFRVDDSLPLNWERISPLDYTRSGYDRGHLIPSADRTNTEANNSATFLMTNIVPQTRDNNRGPWAALEQYSRELVYGGKELFIMAGGYGEKAAIAKGKITPPQRLWKIIVVTPETSLGVEGIVAQTRVIAVDMPNQQGIENIPWQRYKVSVDRLEAKTGYNFLSKVPESIQQMIESQID